MRALREAAEQVGFQGLDELLTFQAEHAGDPNHAEPGRMDPNPVGGRI